jgi:hypothetical protein
MNFIGASVLVILIFVVLFAGRRTALLGIAAGVLFLTQFQAIKLLGFNIFAVRFLEPARFPRGGSIA